MNRIRTILAAAAVSVSAVSVSAGSALAADVGPIVVPVAPPVIAPAPVVHDWSGIYAGVFGGMQWSGGPPPLAAGAQVGFNFQPGRVVIGLQARAGAYMPGFDFHFNVEARVGVALGATGRILPYATAGIVSVPCCAPISLEFGGGVEFGINDRISVFGEARYLFGGVGFRAGVNFHL